MRALCGDVVPTGAAAVLVAQMIHDQAMWGYWALPLHPLVHAGKAHEVLIAFGLVYIAVSTAYWSIFLWRKWPRL